MKDELDEFGDDYGVIEKELGQIRHLLMVMSDTFTSLVASRLEEMKDEHLMPVGCECKICKPGWKVHK